MRVSPPRHRRDNPPSSLRSSPVPGFAGTDAAELLGRVAHTPHVDESAVSSDTLARVGMRLTVPLCDTITLCGAAHLMGLTGATAVVWVIVTLAALSWIDIPAHDRITLRLADDAVRIVQRVAVTIVVVLALRSPLGSGAQVLAGVALIVAGRHMAYATIRTMRRRRWVTQNTLIVGTGVVGLDIADAVSTHPEYGLHIAGFLASEAVRRPHLALGDYRQLCEVAHRHRIRHIIVAFGEAPEPALVDLLRRCAELPVAIHVVPRLFELKGISSGPAVDDVWGIPLVRLPRPPSHRGTWRVKRALDIVVAVLALVALSPVLAVVAAAIRLSGPGGVFFRQQRVTGGGHVFDVIKFRTLVENSDSDTTWSVVSDRRVTRVGRLLRRAGLDEVPQLINVLRGEMTLVGPRPERPHFVERFTAAHPRYDARHRVTAGMTGWAQIHGLRGNTSIRDRVRFDNHYIEHWSLWQDVVILLRTVAVVFRAEGR
jgi:exopolysaccharide biosynthesis polyprenyl glycosylphosphotransferase